MNDYESILNRQRDFFAQGWTKDPRFRQQSLKQLEAWVRSHDTDILAALKADLNKAPFEAYATELGLVLDELRLAIRRIKRWSAERRVRPSIKSFPARGFIRSEPYGVVLIMSPWNYPFMLTVAPLVGALAAGNCAILKPSAYSPHSSRLIAQMIQEVFEPGHVTVVEGGRQENQALLSQAYDYICFTGSVAVGKTVMAAAAPTLTPVTLELGGKSPCIVDETAKLGLAAKRIVWGKFINAGQTCVAPDYLLVHKSIKDKLVQEIISCIQASWGEFPLSNKDYVKIINEKHFHRLLGLLQGEHILWGGGSDESLLKIEPSLLDQVTWDRPVMQEEIFGPLLPILEFSSLHEVTRLVNARPKPLALYLFTTSKPNQDYVLQNISFGGGCINDTVLHLSNPHLPFGGVGASGMGHYHGKAGFDTFSHQKSLLHQSPSFDIPLRYPPYKPRYFSLLKKL